jgi:hypothetical protein
MKAEVTLTTAEKKKIFKSSGNMGKEAVCGDNFS